MFERILFVLFWILFFLLHSGMASGKVKRLFNRKIIVFKYYRLFYNLVSILSLLPIVLLYFVIEPVVFFNPPWWILISGGFLLVLSLLLWKKTFENYSLAEFAGTDRLKAEYALKPILRKTGLNSMVRHPLYTVGYIFMFGLFLLLPNDLILISMALIILYFPLGIYFEEKKLEKIFGKEYRDYKAKTPMLIPNIKKVRSAPDSQRIKFRKD